MSLYTDLATTASKLLLDLGQAATWAHNNDDGTFDPATGVTTSGTTTAYTGNGALLDFDVSRVDGTSVLRTDKRFVLEAASVPEVSDIVTINSIAYQVVSIRETNPAGTVVMYELQLRS
jgi:hypothetical protein|tara:strand:- start:1592 stop:1948 length:357 start_codon:yes stop_codon:yes gene_type:complete